MPTTRKSSALRGAKKGNFAGPRNGLLSHFSDPEDHGKRNWRESFGYERRPEKPEGGQPFIAREVQRSSSDSK